MICYSNTFPFLEQSEPVGQGGSAVGQRGQRVRVQQQSLPVLSHSLLFLILIFYENVLINGIDQILRVIISC